MKSKRQFVEGKEYVMLGDMKMANKEPEKYVYTAKSGGEYSRLVSRSGYVTGNYYNIKEVVSYTKEPYPLILCWIAKNTDAIGKFIGGLICVLALFIVVALLVLVVSNMFGIDFRFVNVVYVFLILVIIKFFKIFLFDT